MLDRPFVLGDFIAVGDMMGTVDYIGLRTTHLQSLSGEQIHDFLEKYYGHAIPTIYGGNGEIEKLIGDGIIAVFGAPFFPDTNANFGAARGWVTAWESTTWAIPKSATFIFTGTGSTLRIQVDSTYSCIGPSPAATPPGR